MVGPTPVFANLIPPEQQVIYDRWPAGASAQQAAWFIDETNGNDENDGSINAPLKSDDERVRRVTDPVLGYWFVNQATTIQYVGNVTRSGGPVFFGANGSLIVKGTATQTFAGTLTAVTALNAATQTRTGITDAALGVGRVGQRIRMTGGAQVGALAWLAKDLGAGAYNTSPFCKMSFAANPLPATPTQTNPTTDTYVIESLSTIATMWWSVVQQNTSVQTNGTSLVFQDIDFSGGANAGSPLVAHPDGATAQPLAFGCNWRSATPDIVFCACRHTPTTFLNGNFQFYGCLVDGGGISVQQGAVAFFDFDTLIQGGASFGLRVRENGYARLGAVCAFDSAADGFIVEDNCIRSLAFLAGNDRVWGNGNTGVGIRLRSGAQWVYTTKPTVTGAGDTNIGGTAKAYAAIPFNDSGVAASGAIMTAFT